MLRRPEIRPGSVMVDELFTGRETDTPARRLGRKHAHAWCHMWCIPGEEDYLHALAVAIGMKRDWFQNKPWMPHYDLTPPRRERAVQAGAVPVRLKDWLRPVHTCPSCHGDKFCPTLGPYQAITCSVCNGRGAIAEYRLQLWQAAAIAREDRQACTGLSLREFAHSRGVSPLLVADMENGRRLPDPHLYCFNPQPQKTHGDNLSAYSDD